jgi:outer membrane lipoprotein SlyB
MLPLKKHSMIGALLIGSFLPFIVCCQRNISPTSYSVGSVGQVNRAVKGVVKSARTVEVDGTTGVGGVAGAATGAVAGSSIGGGGRANAIGAIGGAVVGGIVGAAIERSATRQTAIEYVVETENGALLTLVQGPSPAFSLNDRVIVIYGSPSRLISDQ